MSLIVGVNAGPYVLFGTDTRRVLMDLDTGRILRTNDGYPKLHAIDTGLVTGSGAVTLLDAVARRVRTAGTVQAILDVIAAERAAAAARCHNHPAHREVIDSTGWMLTYRTVNATVRYAMYHPGNGEGLFGVAPGGGAVIVPACPGETEQRAEAEVALTDMLRDGVRLCEPGDPISANIRHNRDLLRRAINEAARRLPRTISRDAMIGIHTNTGQVTVTTYPPIALPQMVTVAA